jgi:Ran-binding protein 3
MSPKPQASKTSDRPESLPQTSDDKFKASGFGTFSSSAASPFGGLASPAAKSPFGAATGSKLGSFAAPAGSKLSSFASSSAASTAPASGFGSLASSNKSAFGGGTLGGGFSGFGTAKPTVSSFETPADLTIKGIASKTIAFGAPGHKSADATELDDENDDEAEKDTTDEERKTSQPLLSQQRMSSNVVGDLCANDTTAHETGEEGEETLWTGRAKLYTMAGEGATKAWKERGVGTFKFNATIEEPKKARFVLRADGTHRLLLNAAVTKQLVFGGDQNGDKPKEGRLLFNSPNTEGELEMHLLKVRSPHSNKYRRVANTP